MKKLTMLTAAFALLAIPLAIPAYAAIEYDFSQRTTHEGAVIPSTELMGRAVLDGDKSRIDFTGGDVYPAGTYMVSIDGSRRLYFVDPEKKWFTEVNTSTISTAVAASNIDIANLKTELEKVGEKEIVAGVATDHYRMTITYDITVPWGSMPLKQSVRTVINTWTTDKFGDVAQLAFNNSVPTGNPQIDKMVETETKRLHGLPMRQSVTITLNSMVGRPVNSELKLPATRTITRETWITRITERGAVQTALFTVPKDYRRSESPDVPAPPMQVLDLQPVSK
jgi:hypothetical protein